MKKNIIISLLIVAGLGGLLWWGKLNQKKTTVNNEVKSQLTSSQDLYDFGTISMKNGNVTKEFEITNPTDQDIFIPSLETSCMCTNAYWILADGNTKGPFGMSGHGYVPPLDETIKAGESRTILVVYNPNAHGPAGVGSIDRFVTLTDSFGNNLNLEIKANVTP